MSDLNVQRPDLAIGRHLLADLYEVQPAMLVNEARLVDIYLTALRQAGFNIINHVSHAFPGEHAGVTGMALLSESHATFHTYPEFGYMAIDVFSCGDPSPEEVLAVIVAALRPGRVETSTLPRGNELQGTPPE
jgi:S-adenosylmethionine decarboxylase